MKNSGAKRGEVDAVQPRPARASVMAQSIILVNLPEDFVHQVCALKGNDPGSIRQDFCVVGFGYG